MALFLRDVVRCLSKSDSDFRHYAGHDLFQNLTILLRGKKIKDIFCTLGGCSVYTYEHSFKSQII